MFLSHMDISLPFSLPSSLSQKKKKNEWHLLSVWTLNLVLSERKPLTEHRQGQLFGEKKHPLETPDQPSEGTHQVSRNIAESQEARLPTSFATGLYYEAKIKHRQ